MIKDKKLRRIVRIAVPILKRNDVIRAGIFGSYARGEQKKKSDIDLLVEIRKKKSLLDFVGIKLELEDRLNKKVDLVEYDTIKPRLRTIILNEEIKII